MSADLDRAQLDAYLNHHDRRPSRLARGILIGLPLAAALWLLLIGAAVLLIHLF